MHSFLPDETLTEVLLMLIAIVPLVVLIVGLLLFALSNANATVKETGRIMLFCGLLVFCFVAARYTLHFP
jgi:hypothetical protein